MKATIEFDDELYRMLKIEAARRGETIRDMVAEGVRVVLGLPTDSEVLRTGEDRPWYGSLRDYAKSAGGEHDLEAIRQSIERGRQEEER